MEKKKKLFYSFLNATLCDRGERKKFNVLFNIPIYDKAKFIFGHIEEISPKNTQNLMTIFSGYFIFWFALLNFADTIFRDFKKNYLVSENFYRNNLYDNLLNIDTFYYFFKFYFEDFFKLNSYFYNLSESYIYDLNFEEQYIYIYNLYFYHSLDRFYLLFNMDALKYEHDKSLTLEKHWDKIPKKILSHFDYNLLGYCNNFFNSFYIIESFKTFNSINGFWINYDFFDIYYLYNNGVSVLDYYIEKKEIELKSKEYDLMPFVLINTRLEEKLDKFSILLRKFKLTLALDFFLVFNFYSLYLRRLRYNYYMRNLPILNEFTGIKHLYVLVNNPFGKNRTKIDILRFQKLFTINYYKDHISQRNFNKKFKLFLSDFTRRKRFYEYNKKLNKFIFKLLLKNKFINFYFKLRDTEYKGLKELSHSPSKFLIYNFLYDSINELLDFLLFSTSFKLLMKFKSVFKFALEGSTYLELCDFVDVIYMSPMPIIKYYFDLQIDLFNEIYEDIYYKNFIMPNFFKDFYNLYKNSNYYFFYLKLSSFFIKLYTLVICGIDLLFFQVYQKNFFYKWTWPYIFLLYYACIFFVYYTVENLNKISYKFIKKIDLLMLRLNWRFNISPYIDYPDRQIPMFFYSHGLVNAINTNRLHNLYNKTLFYFKYNNIKAIHDNFKYSLFLKNIYFPLLYENIEYSLIFFFLNLERILKLLKITWYESTSERLNTTFIYRYYYLTIILDHDRYKDWFDDWSKREFWIFYYWKQYEGYEFYKKRDYL
jgi:hypothetical protein